MSNIPDDELISAYLDGELSGEELARAERLLASQPETRQMLDELTALRASLRELPRQSLGPDFVEHVLRRAEREMLAPVAATPRPPAQAPAADAPAVISWRRWRRPLIWSGLAVAAGLVIMLSAPNRHELQVADAPHAGVEPDMARGPAAAEQQVAASKPAATTAPLDAARQNDSRGLSRSDAIFTTPRYSELDRAMMLAEQDARPLSEFLTESAQKSSSSGNVLVIHCDISPQVAESTLFATVLGRQQIAWQSDVDDGVSALSSTPMAAGESPLALKANAPELAKAEEPAQEAVYVEATPQQIRAALTALATNDEFREVTVSHVSAPSELLSRWQYTGAVNRASETSTAPAEATTTPADNAAARTAAPPSAADMPALSAPRPQKAGETGDKPSDKTAREASSGVRQRQADLASADTQEEAQATGRAFRVAVPMLADQDGNGQVRATPSEGKEGRGAGSDQKSGNEKKRSSGGRGMGGGGMGMGGMGGGMGGLGMGGAEADVSGKGRAANSQSEPTAAPAAKPTASSGLAAPAQEASPSPEDVLRRDRREGDKEDAGEARLSKESLATSQALFIFRIVPEPAAAKAPSKP